MNTQRALQLFLLVFTCTTTWHLIRAECPHLCECKWKGGKESVICLNANLSSVPLQLDAPTQILDLTGNNIVVVRHDEFSDAGLVNLQKIYISKCRLRSLERYAFRNLINLIELDLSYNALTAVPSHTFDSISELTQLRLNGNPIQRVLNDAFTYLPQLVRLEMSECRLVTIEPRAFFGLERTLEFLKLDRNKLTTIASESVTVLDGLNGIELAENPWNCTCHLRPLREWMYRKNIPFGIPPTCNYPKRLQDKLWVRIELDEFACIPEIFAYESKAHGFEGRNVTMTCRIKGIPEPNVRWLLRNKVIANLSGTPYSNGKKLYIVHLQQNASDLTILTADQQDAGVYTCAAENKAGKAEASVTLAVSKKPPENTMSARVFMASVIAGTMFVLSICVVTLCVFTYRKKRTSWHHRPECRNGNDDNYEKIELNHHGQYGKAQIMAGNGDVMTSSMTSSASTRKNGDYSVVPAVDTEEDDDEKEEDEESCQKKDADVWKRGSIEERSVTGAEWVPQAQNIVEDMNDLHIPRRIISEPIREETSSPFTSNTSSSPSLKRQHAPPLSSSTTSAAHGRILPQVPARPSNRDPNLSYQKHPGTTFTLGTSYIGASEATSSGESSSKSRQFPDLIENSPKKYATPGSVNNNYFHTGRASSEGGSITDINELFCTLPRKQRNLHTRYRSTDSQSPLLPDSRYGSSGPDSSHSSQHSSRRASTVVDCPKYPAPNFGSKNKNHQQMPGAANSFASVPHASSKSHISEQSLLNDATPLLDIAGLENRFDYKPGPIVSAPAAVVPTMPTTTNLNSYDYHAAQLERFLEEYRTLQKELTRMKETCDNMRMQDKMQNNTGPMPGSSSNVLGSSSSSVVVVAKSPSSNLTTPNSNQPSNFDGDLTMFLSNTDAKNRILNN